MMRVLPLLLAATFAFGENAHVHPLGPTTETPIEVHFLMPCAALSQSITRDGALIRIVMLDVVCPPISALIPLSHYVSLPERLPPGQYHLEVREYWSEQFIASTDFVVRNAAPAPFEIHPSAVPTSVLSLPMRIDGIVCPTADCAGFTVRIGDTVVSSLRRGNDGAIWFDAPQRYARGLVDVSVQYDDVVLLAPAAVYYFDHADPSIFEPVLFPVLFSADGAYGSKWVSEAVVSNPKPWYVQSFNERFAPNELQRLADGYPRGLALQVPRNEAPDLAFSLRVRDTSRQAEGWGTRVPVVREKDLFHDAYVTLLDVPVDPKYRVKVRVYAFGAFYQPDPYYREFDVPAGAADERSTINVQLPEGSYGWAFATVTNNETQQVTIVTP